MAQSKSARQEAGTGGGKERAEAGGVMREAGGDRAERDRAGVGRAWQYLTEGGTASIYTNVPCHEQLQSPPGQGPLCVPSKQLSVIFYCHKPADSPDSTSQMSEA